MDRRRPTRRSRPTPALLEESGRIAAWLAETAGITTGDRVAILAANDARWVAAFAAILRLGAVVVPLDTGYSSTQVRTIVADSGARVLFAGARYLDTAREAAPSRGVARGRRAGRKSGRVNSSGLREFTRPLFVGRPAVILYTSGTTADPKGVVLTHGNLEAERAAVLSVVKANEDDVVLGVLPLFHALAADGQPAGCR